MAFARLDYQLTENIFEILALTIDNNIQLEGGVLYIYIREPYMMQFWHALSYKKLNGIVNYSSQGVLQSTQ